MRKCEGVTDYKCLECFTVVCSICSIFREYHDIYKEEEKLIGKCENCDRHSQKELISSVYF